MIRESLADSNQIQWQVLAKSLQLQLADSRLWQILYIYSIKCIQAKFVGVEGIGNKTPRLETGRVKGHIMITFYLRF